MEIFELWTHVLEEIKIKNPEYYNNFYSFVFPISFSDGIFTAMTTVPYMIPWINAVSVSYTHLTLPTNSLV